MTRRKKKKVKGIEEILPKGRKRGGWKEAKRRKSKEGRKEKWKINMKVCYTRTQGL